MVTPRTKVEGNNPTQHISNLPRRQTSKTLSEWVNEKRLLDLAQKDELTNFLLVGVLKTLEEFGIDRRHQNWPKIVEYVAAHLPAEASKAGAARKGFRAQFVARFMESTNLFDHFFVADEDGAPSAAQVREIAEQIRAFSGIAGVSGIVAAAPAETTALPRRRRPTPGLLPPSVGESGVGRAPEITPETAPAVVQELTENSDCVVCMDSGCDTAFFECGHLCCCEGCADVLMNGPASAKMCPICRGRPETKKTFAKSETSMLCAGCKNGVVEYAFKGCGHLCLCGECAKEERAHCLVCRKRNYDGLLKVYQSGC